MLHKIKSFFKKKFGHESKPNRLFDLDDWHPLKDRYEVFYDIINKSLDMRDNDPDWAYEPTDDNSVDYFFDHKYIEWMCKEIQKEFKSDIELKRIVNLDADCSGHIDYMYKFAFRLAELENDLLT